MPRPVETPVSPVPRSILAPSQTRLCGFLRSVETALQIAQKHDLFAAGIYQVRQRIEREIGFGRTLEPGCAYRVLRLAREVREKEGGTIGPDTRVLYDFAKELIQYEDRPSPGWLTMLREEGFPADPTHTVNDY